ncbi:uncharacterized protein [Euphorbia lathyris]|uniref:uncharacterized protein n=1 Tax=Euphorbia lathyris TaxID=212925 RepID=UPI0033139195
MQRVDPFASLEQLCHVSSSQEEQLSNSRFAGEPEDEFFSDYDPGGIAVASTGIEMISLPDSPNEKEYDVFHTPAEEFSLSFSQEQQQKNVAVDPAVEAVAGDGTMDDSRAVDLGKNTDLGFSAEVEVTERIAIDSGAKSSPGRNRLNHNKVIHFESMNFRVKEGEVNAIDSYGKTPANKLKIMDKNLDRNSPEPCLASNAAKTLERVVKSIEKLKSPSKNSKKLDQNVVSDSSRNIPGTRTSNFLQTAKKLSIEGASLRNCLNSRQNHQNENVNALDKEFQGDGSAKRKLDETLESEIEENVAVSGVNLDSIYDMDKLRNVRPSSENSFRNVRPCSENSSGKRKSFGGKRVLPVSLLGNISNAQEQVVSKKEITVLDVLRELAKEHTFDHSLAKLSALEAAKRGGMNFP